MKAKEIEKHLAAQTLVAVGRRSGDFPYCKPASIAAMRQPRKVYNSRGFGSHNVSDGVQVLYEDGRTEVVPPSNVHMTWAEYEAQKAKRDEASRSKQQARESIRDKAHEAVAELKTLTGIDSYGAIQARVDAYGIATVTLSATAAEAIVKMLSERDEDALLRQAARDLGVDLPS